MLPLFYLQAGRARVFAGQTALGMPSLMQGLELLSEQRLFLRLHRARRRLINELRERGLEEEAAEIEAWMTIPEASASETESQELRQNGLFSPHIVPPVARRYDPDEVEWLDEVTAECDYCGSPIREYGKRPEGFNCSTRFFTETLGTVCNKSNHADRRLYFTALTGCCSEMIHLRMDFQKLILNRGKPV